VAASSVVVVPLDQRAAAMESQTSITVGHEDLRTVEDVDIFTAPGGLLYVNNPTGASPTSWPSTPRRPAGLSSDPRGFGDSLLCCTP